MKNIQKLKEARDKVIKEMRVITGEAEKRDDRKMTEDEGKRWTELNAKVDEMKAEIDREIRMQALDAEGTDDPPSTPGSKKDERRNIPLGEDLKAVVDKRGESRVITGMSELVPADGGFFVNTDQSAELITTTFTMASLAPKCKKITISANSNAVTFNAIAETSRVTGNRFGGLNGFWLEEGGTKTATQPVFRQIELKLKKLAAICYLTDELIQDAAALQSMVQSMFPEEFAWLIDDAIYRGAGGGQPIGILGHASAVNVAIQPGQTLANGAVVYENIVDMFTRMAPRSMPTAEWYINQTCLPWLYTMALAVGFGGVPVYMPANGASSAPYGTLMGKPVNVIEHASALGTVGDIAFLDVSQYLLAQKGGIDQASSIHVRFLNDETVLRFVQRIDGQPLWNAPITPADASANTFSPFVFLAVRV